MIKACLDLGKDPAETIAIFRIPGAWEEEGFKILDRYGVAVRAGTHCAEPLLARYGTTSTCRASFAMYNTVQEVDILIEALHKAREMFA